MAIPWPRTFDRTPWLTVSDEKKKPAEAFETAKVPCKISEQKIFLEQLQINQTAGLKHRKSHLRDV